MMSGKTFYIVGKHLGRDAAWEFFGLFDDIELAEAQCLDWEFFVAPVVMNEIQPGERTDWPGLYYPKAA